MGEIIPKQYWFVANTRSCQEKKVFEALSTLGLESYLPLQTVRRKWSDRVKILRQPVLPRIVFVHCPEPRRRTLSSEIYGITGFMMDRGRQSVAPLRVPDIQIESFRKFIDGLDGVSEVSFVSSPIQIGEKVRIINGPLQGFVCECVELHGRHHIAVRLGILGAAVAQVDIKDIIKMNI